MDIIDLKYFIFYTFFFKLIKIRGYSMKEYPMSA